MSDPKWPDELFKAVHDASGTHVKVTPIDYRGEPDLWPHSMKMKGQPAQDLHWADVEAERTIYVQQRLAAMGVEMHVSGPAAFHANTASVFFVLLKTIERLEARIAKLETPAPPPEGT